MPPIPQVPQGGERRPIHGSEQRVRLGLEHGHGGHGYDGMHLICKVIECATS